MNILIRRAEVSDCEAIQQIFAGEKAVLGTLQLPFPSVDMWRKKLSEPPEGFFNLVACVEKGVVGNLGLHTFPSSPRRRHVGLLGMAVHDDWQGKGIGKALVQEGVNLADKWLNLIRLELEVYCDNEPAIALYKRFGFEIEGKLIKYAYRNGEYVDSYSMARLR